MAYNKIGIYLLFLLTSLALTNLTAQNTKQPDVILEQVELPDKSLQILASNTRNFSQIVFVKLISMKNMETTNPEPLKKVLKANEEDVLITTLIPELGKPYGVSVEYINYPGEIINTNIDKDYIYSLPFETGKSYFVGQGYNGQFSHHMKYRNYALDFDMPMGSKVCAVRSGKVITLKQDSDRRGNTINSAKYANYITIGHEDGSLANYYHLQQNGVLVKEGDIVKEGDVIGLSGNTGWSDGPHLHLEIFYFDDDGNMVSIPTKFKTQNEKPESLKEGKSYTRK